MHFADLDIFIINWLFVGDSMVKIQVHIFINLGYIFFLVGDGVI